MYLKVCGLKYYDNIKTLLTLKPKFVGFIFHKPSPRNMPISFLEKTKNLNFKSTKKVGVFVNKPIYFIEKIAKKGKLDLIQLHGTESPLYCKLLKKKLKLPIIKAFSIKTKKDLEPTKNYYNTIDYFLFDTKTKLAGGSGKKFDWSVLNYFNQEKPFFLSGGIDLEDFFHIKHLPYKNLYCLDINSKFEQHPGLKKVDKIKLVKNNIKFN